MSISLWGILSRFWLGQKTGVARSAPHLDPDHLPAYLARDIGLRQEHNFSLPSSFRDRKISPLGLL